MNKSMRTILLIAAAGTAFSGHVSSAADVTGERLVVGIAIDNNGVASSIAGGEANNISTNSFYCLIGAGLDNVIGTNCSTCTIVCANIATIHPNVEYAFIGGGSLHNIYSSFGTVCGGNNALITANGLGSFIGGGNDHVADALYVTLAGGAANTIRGPGGAIVGGLVNTISTNADYAFIGAGKYNFIFHEGEYSAIVGGISNAIGTHAEYSYIGNGERNTNNSSFTYLGSGYWNLISTNADYSFLGGGTSNKVTATRATITGGDSASAANYGQQAYASGAFASTGDAQSSKYVLRNSTTNATQKEIFLNGSSARMSVPSGSTWVFEGQVVARSSSGSSAGYRFKGAIDNNGGTTSLVYTPSVEPIAEDDAGWDISIQADDVNEALVIKVTGAASTNIRWVATVNTTEVSY